MNPSELGRPPRVLAIIVTWNKRDCLDGVLADLLRLERPPDEVVVVDNASTDDTVKMVREKYPDVHLLCNDQNLGGSGGFNAGMRWGLKRGGFDYFWLMDNDIVVHAGALSVLLEVAESDPRVALAGSRIGELERPGRTQEIGAAIDWKTANIVKLGCREVSGMPGSDGAKRPMLFDAMYVTACSCLARVKAIEVVGTWDEGFFVFFDDVEWGLRFNRAGWKVKGVSASFVEHESFWERRLDQNLNGVYYNLRNRLTTAHRFCPGWRRPLALFRNFHNLCLTNCQFDRDGRSELARCNRLSARDFFRSVRGACKHVWGKETMPRTPGVSDHAALSMVPNRKGRILLWTLSASEGTRKAIDLFKARFANHEIDIFIPSGIPEIEFPRWEGVIQRPTRTWRHRLALARWARENYDAMARDSRRTRTLFDYTFPVSIWYSPDGAEVTVTVNRLTDLLLAAWSWLWSLPVAAAMTARAILKPRDRVDYFTWNPKREKPPRALAIIVSWNKRDFLDRLLAGLRRLKRPPDEILVVDNASSDHTLEMVRDRYPGVHLIANAENLGGSGGFNAGMRWGLERGGFDYFWLCDNDIRVHEGALEALLDVMESDLAVALAGSRMAELGRLDRTQEIGAIIQWRTGFIQKLGCDGQYSAFGEGPAKLFDADYVSACSALARVTAIEQVGIWDEGYFLYFDDIEWGLRFKRAGWKVIGTSASLIEHEGSLERRYHQPLSMWRLHWRNLLHCYRKMGAPFQRLFTFFHVIRGMLLASFQFWLDGRTQRARSYVLGIVDFLRSVRGRAPRSLPEDLTLGQPAGSPEAPPVPERKGRILFWADNGSAIARRAIEEVKKRFPNHQVDVFVPAEVAEIEVSQLNGFIRRPTLTRSDRRALGRWILRIYDAVASGPSRFRLLFELRSPVSIWYSKNAEVTVSRNLWAALWAPTILARPLIVAAAAALAIIAAFKPLPRVNYFNWSRHPSDRSKPNEPTKMPDVDAN